MFRWFALAVLLGCLSVSTYYRRQARLEAGTIPRHRESGLLMAGRAVVGLPLFLSVVIDVMNPRVDDMTVAHQTRFVAAALVMLLLVVPSGSVSQPTGDVRVIILSPNTSDVRLPLTREAIAFWNETFATLNLGSRLRETEVIVTSARGRAFENYARRISQRAGRLSAGPAEPAPPAEVVEIGGDVVLLLSRQDIMSFAWPLPRSTRYFVAIETGPNSAAANPNVARNVIAHELGHTLGLTHNNDPTTLMCGPCRPSALGEDEPAFLPLTRMDLARLVELHPSVEP